MTTPASAIKDEVRLLIDVQIETFGQPAPLTSSQLHEFRQRSLCQSDPVLGKAYRSSHSGGEDRFFS
jgi:hypothetical protein